MRSRVSDLNGRGGTLPRQSTLGRGVLGETPNNSSPSVLQALDAMQLALTMLRVALASSSEPTKAVRLVGLKEAARQLGVHERTIRRQARLGAGVKVGGTWRVDVEELRSAGRKT